MPTRTLFQVMLLVAGLIVTGGVAGAQGSPASRTRPPAGVAAGRVEEFAQFDSTYRRTRHIWIYTPPGYDAKAPVPYPLLLAFDGREYLDTIPLPLILDTLLAGRHAPPMVAVLVDDSSFAVRLGDLANQPRMVSYLASQLLPWVRSRYHVTRDPQRTIVTGSSAGGLASAYAAFARPHLFGNVLSQSGAFWRGAAGSNGAPFEWLTGQLSAAPKKDIVFLLDVGALENHPTLGGSGPNFLDATRRFCDALLAMGYMTIYSEVPGGVHAPRTWRERLP
ncbi:MAG TPA: alpha/beta hydrolase-fold protein, partial [Gemmatimonadaceae bacterium]|nr:alpha/beta hydrolase-fold protein [Gemmatimonadaceae bacterium]